MTLILTKSESSLPAIKQVQYKDSGAIEKISQSVALEPFPRRT